MKNLILCSFLLLFVGFTYSQETIKLKEIGLEVMKEALGQMTWYDALKTCAELGDGWRLPTKHELENYLFKNKDKIGGFKEGEMDKYWSATQCGDGGYGKLGHAWTFSFDHGKAMDGYNDGHTAYSYLYNVRAVRHIEK